MQAWIGPIALVAIVVSLGYLVLLMLLPPSTDAEEAWAIPEDEREALRRRQQRSAQQRSAQQRSAQQRSAQQTKRQEMLREEMLREEIKKTRSRELLEDD